MPSVSPETVQEEMLTVTRADGSVIYAVKSALGLAEAVYPTMRLATKRAEKLRACGHVCEVIPGAGLTLQFRYSYRVRLIFPAGQSPPNQKVFHAVPKKSKRPGRYGLSKVAARRRHNARPGATSLD
jgi:hypothetical protein